MSRVRRYHDLALAAAGASLLAGYAQEGRAAAAVPALLLLALSAFGLRRRWPFTAGLALAATVATAAAGLLLGHSPGPSLGAVTAALAAWDLAAFTRRLAAAPPGAAEALAPPHLRRLAGVLALGLALGALALNLTLDLGFGLALTITGLLALTLAALVTRLRQAA